MKREYVWAVSISIIVLAVSGALDASLQLGSFSGLVFALYSTYGLAIGIVGLLITAAVTKNTHWAYAAGVPAVCLGILLSVNALV